MSLTIETATLRIGTKIQKTEDLADEFASSAAELLSEIAQARRAFRGHEAAKFAQPAMMRASKAIEAIIAARGELARVHSSLLEANNIKMAPAQDDCPDWVNGPMAVDESVAA